MSTNKKLHCLKIKKQKNSLQKVCQKYTDLLTAHLKQNVIDVATCFLEQPLRLFQTFFHDKIFRRQMLLEDKILLFNFDLCNIFYCIFKGINLP